jgi:hypothetical protein
MYASPLTTFEPGVEPTDEHTRSRPVALGYPGMKMLHAYSRPWNSLIIRLSNPYAIGST